MAVSSYVKDCRAERARRIIDEMNVLRTELDQGRILSSQAGDESSSIELSLRNELVDASKSLVDSLTDPYNYWMDIASSYMETEAFDVFMRFRLYESLPADGSISVHELASIVGIDENRLSRILRVLVLRFCVSQPQPAHFAHGIASKWLLHNVSIAAYVETALDTFQKAATSLAESIHLNPTGENSYGTSFTTRFGEDLYSYWAKNKSKMQRFQLALHDRHLVSEAVASYPWHSIQGKIVDVGGGNGQIAIEIAQLYPQLTCCVQDTFVSEDRLKLVENLGLSERIVYEVHDYYQPQPVRDASAYFLKHCLHNNNDHDCIRIIKALVPALETNSSSNRKLLICEYLLPEEGDKRVSRDYARQLHNADMAMMVLFNAQERTASQYQALLSAADTRLEIRHVHHNGNDRLSTMEIQLKEAKTNGSQDT